MKHKTQKLILLVFLFSTSYFVSTYEAQASYMSGGSNIELSSSCDSDSLGDDYSLVGEDFDHTPYSSSLPLEGFNLLKCLSKSNTYNNADIFVSVRIFEFRTGLSPPA